MSDTREQKPIYRVERCGVIFWQGEKLDEARKVGAEMRTKRSPFNIVRQPTGEIIEKWGW